VIDDEAAAAAWGGGGRKIMVEERIQEESRVTWKQLYNLWFWNLKESTGRVHETCTRATTSGSRDIGLLNSKPIHRSASCLIKVRARNWHFQEDLYLLKTNLCHLLQILIIWPPVVHISIYSSSSTFQSLKKFICQGLH